MPGLNFQPRFAELVESGAKTQTIRAPRKRPIQVGDRLYLWTGQRTKGARKLGEGVATWVELVQISANGVGMSLSMAVRDGFDSIDEAVKWFRAHHGLPFQGHLIRWRLLPRSEWRRA